MGRIAADFDNSDIEVAIEAEPGLLGGVTEAGINRCRPCCGLPHCRVRLEGAVAYSQLPPRRGYRRVRRGRLRHRSTATAKSRP